MYEVPTEGSKQFIVVSAFDSPAVTCSQNYFFCIMCFGVARERGKNLNELHRYVSRRSQLLGGKQLQLIHWNLQYFEILQN